MSANDNLSIGYVYTYRAMEIFVPQSARSRGKVCYVISSPFLIRVI